jgi:hypothetical protein
MILVVIWQIHSFHMVPCKFKQGNISHQTEVNVHETLCRHLRDLQPWRMPYVCGSRYAAPLEDWGTAVGERNFMLTCISLHCLLLILACFLLSICPILWLSESQDRLWTLLQQYSLNMRIFSQSLQSSHIFLKFGTPTLHFLMPAWGRRSDASLWSVRCLHLCKVRPSHSNQNRAL